MCIDHKIRVPVVMCLGKIHTHYTLSVAIEVVQLFVPPRGSCQLCAPLAAWCGLADRVYHYIWDTKNILALYIYCGKICSLDGIGLTDLPKIGDARVASLAPLVPPALNIRTVSFLKQFFFYWFPKSMQDFILSVPDCNIRIYLLTSLWQ